MQTHYERIGGEEVVHKLVDRFYDLMDQQQDFQSIRELHAKSLKASREKLFMFLSGWLGGPQLYVEKYGHPRLRQRHLPFAIGDAERDQWMNCMIQAMQDLCLEEGLRKELAAAFQKTADFMRNKES
ncbi:MAG: group II truncated hemoglobin [Gammaproteobacteria bacterium]|nr:group II truncated hemoglobin [Gammaproteobacteria bacterium]MBU1977906.1 group II truncated hemoglobin [Gammaproteobacteria bacterium]